MQGRPAGSPAGGGGWGPLSSRSWSCRRPPAGPRGWAPRREPVCDCSPGERCRSAACLRAGGGRRRRECGAPHLLHRLEDPQQVVCQDALDLCLGPLSPQQLGSQVWILGHVLKPRGKPEMRVEKARLCIPGGRAWAPPPRPSQHVEGGLASPGHTIVVPTQAHGSGPCHLLDVVQVICGEVAREGPVRRPGPEPRPLSPAHLPLGTSWPPLCRKRSHCRSSPSPGCPSASARERGRHRGQGGQATGASPGADGPGPASHHQLEHVVGHVAPVLAHTVGRGVAEDHGGLGQLQHSLHGGHGRMGQVDDDTQSVHLLHDTLRGDGAQGTRTAWRVSASTLGPGGLCRARWGSHDLLGFLAAAWEVQVWGRALARC